MVRRTLNTAGLLVTGRRCGRTILPVKPGERIRVGRGRALTGKIIIGNPGKGDRCSGCGVNPARNFQNNAACNPRNVLKARK